jgi:hypothetical protein
MSRRRLRHFQRDSLSLLFHRDFSNRKNLPVTPSRSSSEKRKKMFWSDKVKCHFSLSLCVSLKALLVNQSPIDCEDGNFCCLLSLGVKRQNQRERERERERERHSFSSIRWDIWSPSLTTRVVITVSIASISDCVTLGVDDISHSNSVMRLPVIVRDKSFLRIRRLSVLRGSISLFRDFGYVSKEQIILLFS